ncbi:CopG family transcriptional regulator [Candidatus Leptofilum sp.]|uniref:ribbon-helix-helix domain-containing protein n=1 Tax=Candidatus Leptofilum sp. TaxID=3241576 RepID=UPI003B5AA9A0
MTEKMVRTQVYLPQDIYEKLKSRADEEGITMATQIREALAEYVVEQPEEKEGHVLTEDDPIWQLIGIGKGGPPDGSVNHDKYIYTRDWDPEDDA